MRLLIILVLCAVGLSLAPRQLLMAHGDWLADSIADGATSDQNRILLAARHVAEQYDGHGHTPLYHRLLPVLTGIIPVPFRIPRGAIELVTRDGECDAAVRALIFLLQRMGYEAAQINMITPVAAHSAVMVKRPTGSIYLDPYYGIAAVSRFGNALADLQAAIGADRFREVALNLRETPDTNYYLAYVPKGLFSALQGQDPHMVIKLPPLNGKTRQFGTLDDETQDVMSALNGSSISGLLHYVGSRYDRAWTRTVIAPENMRLQMQLIDEAEDELIVSSIPPTIDENTVTWHLKAGQPLVLYDNRRPHTHFSYPYQEADVIRLVPE